MSKRYFKATDGRITIFRASWSRAFQSARINGHKFGFLSSIEGRYEAEEIDDLEFNVLTELKRRRVFAKGDYRRKIKAGDSWVANDAIEAYYAPQPRSFLAWTDR